MSQIMMELMVRIACPQAFVHQPPIVLLAKTAAHTKAKETLPLFAPDFHTRGD
jgi:hypothetical protein